MTSSVMLTSARIFFFYAVVEENNNQPYLQKQKWRSIVEIIYFLKNVTSKGSDSKSKNLPLRITLLSA